MVSTNVQLYGCPRDHRHAPWCSMVRAGAVCEVSSQAAPFKKVSCTLATGPAPTIHRCWQAQLDHFTHSEMHDIMSRSRSTRRRSAE